MGSVSSPFFCKSFQLSKDYKEFTNCFYVLYRIQIQIQMLRMTKSFIFLNFFLSCKPFVRGAVLKRHEEFWSRVDGRTSEEQFVFVVPFRKRRDS